MKNKIWILVLVALSVAIYFLQKTVQKIRSVKNLQLKKLFPKMKTRRLLKKCLKLKKTQKTIQKQFISISFNIRERNRTGIENCTTFL